MPNHHTAGHGYTICTAAYHWMITLSLIAIISIPSVEAFIIISHQSPSQRVHPHSITQSQQRCALPFSFPSTQYFSLYREKNRLNALNFLTAMMKKNTIHATALEDPYEDFNHQH